MKKKTHHKKRRTLWIILASLVVVVIAVRLWLPSLILKEVNKKLKNDIDGYTGSVDDIDLFILAGSYSIKGVELNKTGGKIPVPFFAADEIDLSVEWRALFKGEIVGEIEVQKPVLNYVKGPTKATTQTSIDKDWTEVVDELMPLRINRFEATEGEIHYRDFHSKPKVDLEMTNVFVVATNLTNVNDEEKLLPSTVTGTADLYEGTVKLNMKINPLQKTPTFDLNAELTTMELKNLNDFLRAYGNFDVQKGTFSVYAEAATRDNKIVGYAKPIIKDIKVAEWKKEEEGNIFQKAWESLVGFAAWVFKNQSKDQLATQVEFEGSIKNPDVDTWSIIGETLQNAFIKALVPSIENSISIGSADKLETDPGALSLKEKDDKKEEKKEGFLKKLFKKKDEKKEEKKKEKEEEKKEQDQ
jgi:hypothetical protein